MKRYYVVIFALYGLVQGQVSLGSAGEKFTSLTTNGAWYWYQDPRNGYGSEMLIKILTGIFFERIHS